MGIFFVALSVVMWLAVVSLPWRPWSTRERLAVDPAAPHRNLDDITVLVPARDEETCIAKTLTLLRAQGQFARIIVINDQSEDGTREIINQQNIVTLKLVEGSAPPEGWSGKLWALEQGLKHCDSNFVLLLDADIGLKPGTVSALLTQLEASESDMASLMANLHMQQFWEKLLLPPFVYFFKLIYPFALANSPRSSIAAGAGGCVLIKSSKLHEIGGFSALKDAIIDDCTLAQKVKESPGRIWIGLSNDAYAIRPYSTLSNIWNMVARTAYTQLRYSPSLLIACTVLLLLSYVVPIGALIFGTGSMRLLAVVCLVAMLGSYVPTIRYYKLPLYWAFSLPLAAVLFLGMTWTSAIRYSRGERARWKNRSYARAVSTSTEK